MNAMIIILPTCKRILSLLQLSGQQGNIYTLSRTHVLRHLGNSTRKLESLLESGATRENCRLTDHCMPLTSALEFMHGQPGLHSSKFKASQGYVVVRSCLRKLHIGVKRGNREKGMRTLELRKGKE